MGLLGSVRAVFVYWRNGEKVLIEPRKGKREEPLPRTVCLISVPEDLDYILSNYADYFISKRKIFISDCYLYEQGKRRAAFVGPILGAPQAALVLEKAIALGANNFIFVGWCGSLQDNITIGDFVIPVAYVSEEGTSSHYPVSHYDPESSFFSSFKLFKSYIDSLKKKGGNVYKGRVWTTDAPYRETVSKVVFYGQKGVLCVDMESSALARVATYRGVNIGIVLIVSDTLSTLKWKPGLKSPMFKFARKLLLETLMDVLAEEGA